MLAVTQSAGVVGVQRVLHRHVRVATVFSRQAIFALCLANPQENSAPSVWTALVTDAKDAVIRWGQMGLPVLFWRPDAIRLPLRPDTLLPLPCPAPLTERMLP